MKKLMLGLVVGTTLMSSAAMAGEQRPTYMAFSAPAAANVASAQAAVATPSVAKRDKSFGTLPIWVPIVGLIAVVGRIAAVSGGGDNNGSPG
ncbi:hypothetical protein HNO88_003451 [Novosphingobium chloroacetimidivorans]|uniref:Uncharacterized protein n=1 Tax=Novosphingobium chloroacetimidivorans TaxID=1428314 RepID=A0A7W7KC48_9SPHN|nr:hypothetical protein [Novosphingobium chloroacetimidivorans]MBB4860110.1 hypothetical protein [Novosphingobium chloroacetimidivorans]